MTAPVPLTSGLRCLCAQVRLRLYARIAWAGRDHQSADAPWLDAWTEPGARVAWAASDARGRELDGALRAIADVRDERFERVVQAFQLDAAERDALQMCLAVAIDPTLAGVLAEAEGRAYVTEAAIARTFDHGLNRPVVADSPLRRWELVDVRDVGPGEPPALSIDPTVRDSICGTPRLDAALVGCARVIERHPVPSAWPVAALTQQIATQIRIEVERGTAQTAVPLVSGEVAAEGRGHVAVGDQDLKGPWLHRPRFPRIVHFAASTRSEFPNKVNRQGNFPVEIGGLPKEIRVNGLHALVRRRRRAFQPCESGKTALSQ